MNRNKKFILTNSYEPHRPKTYLHDEKDLHTRHLEERYNKIVSSPDFYFERMKITNFDLINHECRGDDLEHDRHYYETIYKKRVDDELFDSIHRYHFVSAACRSGREDVHLDKELQAHHLRTDLKEQLKQNGIYLSAMQKRKKCTVNCKTLPF